MSRRGSCALERPALSPPGTAAGLQEVGWVSPSPAHPDIWLGSRTPVPTRLQLPLLDNGGAA